MKEQEIRRINRSEDKAYSPSITISERDRERFYLIYLEEQKAERLPNTDFMECGIYLIHDEKDTAHLVQVLLENDISFEYEVTTFFIEDLEYEEE